MSAAAPEYYSIRQLSPFLGTIQVVEAAFCRALSADGINWQIQASCETGQQQMGIKVDRYIPRRYVLYAQWNQQSGLSALPLDPMLDVPSIEHIRSRLITPLKDLLDSLPFPAQDQYECWLIDRHSQQPLALIASARHGEMIEHITPPHWQAISAQERDKALNSTLGQDSIDRLEKAINSQGEKPLWFKRADKLTATPVASTAAYYDVAAFPELLLNTQLLPAEIRRIADHYLQWQAPRLLSLTHIDSHTRLQLESQAQHDARQTAKRLKTYPVPLSKTIYNKVHVELKLRGL